ncbi:Uncharacterized protein Adt_46451 [Abeliophyllum distichum]|uniref:Uncharacterized protein n=1 Tax=Abeliophyllum distichum TaxID=126358 RepID=A0ABD1P3B3_9LAMI
MAPPVPQPPMALRAPQVSQVHQAPPAHQAAPTVPLSALQSTQDNLIKDFESMKIEVLTPPVRTSAVIASSIVKSAPRDRIVTTQKDNIFLEKIRIEVGTERRKKFKIVEDSALMFKGRICVPKDKGSEK